MLFRYIIPVAALRAYTRLRTASYVFELRWSSSVDPRHYWLNCCQGCTGLARRSAMVEYLDDGDVGGLVGCLGFLDDLARRLSLVS